MWVLGVTHRDCQLQVVESPPVWVPGGLYVGPLQQPTLTAKPFLQLPLPCALLKHPSKNDFSLGLRM